MSRTVDTNILVYATHSASPFHDRARALVEHLVAGPGLAYLFWPAILGYLRIVTHPNILRSPLSSDDAMSNVGAMIAPSHVRVAGEGSDFWASFRAIAADVKPRGNLVPDAHLVALMREHGVSTIWSHDRDLRRFRGITVKDPFSEKHSTGFEEPYSR
jgi:toxin-antitoxin system PIN domain toxin